MAYVLTPRETEKVPREQAARGARGHRPASSPGVAEDHSRPDRPRRWGGIVGRLSTLLRLFRRPLPAKDLILFSSQLGIMIETGTSLVAGLEALEAQTTNGRLRRALTAVRIDVMGGQMLSTAMGRHLDVFPETLVGMIAIGESGGVLDRMLDRLTTILEKQAEMRSTIRSALSYPLILAAFCVLVVGFMVAFILPRFVDIFADMEAVLPAPTRLLLTTVDVLGARWMFIVPGAAASIVLVLAFLRTSTGRRLLDRGLLSFPMIGPLVRHVSISRLLRSVGELMQAGVPLLDAIQVSGPFVGNVLYRDLVGRVEQSIVSGNTFSGPIGESDLVPATVHQMLQTGEQTGALATTMVRAADFYDRRATVQAKTLTTVLEPLMIFLVGGIVAFVVISLLLPIFRMSSVVH